MRKYFHIFLYLFFISVNICQAGIMDALKEKREKAIERMQEERKERANNIQQEMEKKNILQESQEYFTSSMFHYRKIIFVIGLGLLWIFIWIYAIFIKSAKKAR